MMCEDSSIERHQPCTRSVLFACERGIIAREIESTFIRIRKSGEQGPVGLGNPIPNLKHYTSSRFCCLAAEFQ